MSTSLQNKFRFEQYKRKNRDSFVVTLCILFKRSNAAVNTHISKPTKPQLVTASMDPSTLLPNGLSSVR